MRLNLKGIAQAPGASVPFDFQLDLSALDFYGHRPMVNPVQVSGEVRNRAGALELSGVAESVLSLVCDRCAASYLRPLRVAYKTLVGADLQDAEQDEVVPLIGGELDVGELMQAAFVLGMDSKNLCREDCKGLCCGCGADLNTEACRCKRGVDPRLAKLAKLLEE